jgi:hypothetical protein
VLDQQTLAAAAVDIGVATVRGKRISQVMMALADIPAAAGVRAGPLATWFLFATLRGIAVETAN